MTLFENLISFLPQIWINFILALLALLGLSVQAGCGPDQQSNIAMLQQTVTVMQEAGVEAEIEVRGSGAPVRWGTETYFGQDINWRLFGKLDFKDPAPTGD